MKVNRISLLVSLFPLLVGAEIVLEQGIHMVNGATIVLEDETLQNNGKLTSTGTIKVTGGNTSSIGGEGTITLNILEIEKAGATTRTSLSGAISVNGKISTKSDLNLNGNKLKLGNTGTLNETTGRVLGDSGQISATRELDAPDAENVAGLGAIITSSKDLGSTQIIRGHHTQSGEFGTSIKRYYDIVPTNNENLDATLAFSYHELEVLGTDSVLRLFMSEDGDLWQGQSGVVDVTNNTVTVSQISNFSRWTAAANTAPKLLSVESFVIGQNGSIEVGIDRAITEDLDGDALTLQVGAGTNYIVSGGVITPKSGFTGVLSVSFYVNDGLANSNEITKKIEVRNVADNNAPTISAVNVTPIEKNHSQKVTLDMISYEDADGDDVSITLFEGENYTLDGLTIIPKTDFIGDLNVPVQVSDGIASTEKYLAKVSVFEKSIHFNQGQVIAKGEGKVVVYPNPLKTESEALLVRGSGKLDRVEIKMFNMAGRRIAAGATEVQDESYQYNLRFGSQLLKGNYALTINGFLNGKPVSREVKLIGVQ